MYIRLLNIYGPNDHQEERADGTSGFPADELASVLAYAARNLRSSHDGVYHDTGYWIELFKTVALLKDWDDAQILASMYFSFKTQHISDSGTMKIQT